MGYLVCLTHNVKCTTILHILHIEMHVVVVVICCLFLLPPTLGGESHSFPHAPRMCVVDVILAHDCPVFFPFHYWEFMEHNSK